MSVGSRVRPASISLFLSLLFLFAGVGYSQVTEYPVRAGSHPHDVAPAPDGRVWYTAQRQGALGWLDPDSGMHGQIPLGNGSRPHGVIVGPNGAAWITDSGLNAIVRVDPVSEDVEISRCLIENLTLSRQMPHPKI